MIQFKQGGEAAPVSRLCACLRRGFSGTAPALALVACLVFGLVAGCTVAATYWPRSVGFVLLCLAAFLLSALVFRFLLRRWSGHPAVWLAAALLLLGSVLYIVEEGAGEGWSWRVILFSVGSALVLAAFSIGWWSVFVRRAVSFPAAAVCAVSTLCAAALGILLFTDGFDNHYLARYLTLSQPAAAGVDTLDTARGPWETAVLEYGPESELASDTVDLTRYMVRDDGDLTDHYLEAYWDYDLNAVPMQGRVWYPVGGQNCPVLFIAHGNHKVATRSYLGYDYLGDYLASHGYVVISVDQNACNMLSNENDGRAVLLLEHIRLCLTYNSTEGNPLYNLLDEDNIAIGGHSRGGEMVATAYLFNDYDHYPENGAVRFDYHFSIRSLIAIAPTVDQYMPADHGVELEDVSYLLLHGAADRDVTDFAGMTQYSNITFTGECSAIKSALYIAGANHGQFNTLWGEYDAAGPFTTLFNTESLIPAQDQRQILCVFTRVFLDVTLRGDTENLGLLTDWDDYAPQLPPTVYFQCYETSSFVPIADFEEDSDLETATMEGVSISVVSPSIVWTEELMDFGDSDSGDTHALHLYWSDEASFSAALPRLDLSGRCLVFDICDLDSASVAAGDYALLDGEVALTDVFGHRAVARIRDVATVYPILPVRTDKLDYIFDTCAYKKAFSTVSIPASAFVPEGEALDLSRIKSLEINFDTSGDVAIDNIGLETPME